MPSVRRGHLLGQFAPRTNECEVWMSGARLTAVELVELRMLRHLAPDPAIRYGQTSLESRSRLPAEHFAQLRVVGVATAHALRRREVVALPDRLPRSLRDEIDQLVDRHQPVRAEVQRLAMVGLHQPIDPLDAVVDVAVAPGLLTVAPHLDLSTVD